MFPSTLTSIVNKTWLNENVASILPNVKKEIAAHKANGRPVFYSKKGVPIMELADGRCFEYRLLEDGRQENIREVPRNDSIKT